MTDREFTRRLSRAVITTVLALVVLAVMWRARQALVVVYVSVLLATGLGPIVHAIEHQTTSRGERLRIPRWLAILLIYVTVVGTLLIIGLLVTPPLVRQARDLWTALPEQFD